MARINLNEFSAQAGGVAYRANQVRTDPAVVKAAQDAWRDVKDARDSCTVLAREANAAWQRSRTVVATPRDADQPESPAPAWPARTTTIAS
jgi:hypothetical protein